MKPNKEQNRSNEGKERESDKKRKPYFDPTIPDEPLMSDEDIAVNASNVEK